MRGFKARSPNLQRKSRCFKCKEGKESHWSKKKAVLVPRTESLQREAEEAVRPRDLQVRWQIAHSQSMQSEQSGDCIETEKGGVESLPKEPWFDLGWETLSGKGNTVPSGWPQLETVLVTAFLSYSETERHRRRQDFSDGPLVETQRAGGSSTGELEWGLNLKQSVWWVDHDNDTSSHHSQNAYFSSWCLTIYSFSFLPKLTSLTILFTLMTFNASYKELISISAWNVSLSSRSSYPKTSSISCLGCLIGISKATYQHWGPDLIHRNHPTCPSSRPAPPITIPYK